MKKAFIALAGISCLGLLSFMSANPQQKASNCCKVTRLQPNSYQVDEVAKGGVITPADQNKITSILQKEYGVASFKQGQVLDGKPQAGKWWAIAKKKICTNVFTEVVICGDSKSSNKVFTASQKELDALFAKYAK